MLDIFPWLIAILAGLAVFARFLKSRSVIRNQREVGKLLEFEEVRQVGDRDRDSSFQTTFQRGEIDGVTFRIGTLEVSPGDDFEGRREHAKDEQQKHWVTAISIPVETDGAYLMTRRRVSPGEARIFEEEYGFVEGDTPVDAHFLVLHPPGQPPTFLEDEDVARRLTELARTYSVVRLFAGWLSVANDTFDPDLIDVDFEHLREAHRHLTNAMSGK